MNGFSDSDLFLCAYGLCLHCEDSGKERQWVKEREEGGKKQVWPKPSQLSPRCLTEVIVSDRGGSHEPWTEPRLELARNKTRFSRSEETAVLNEKPGRECKRKGSLHKIKSNLGLLSFPPIPPSHTAYHIASSFKQTVGAAIVSALPPIPYCVEVNYWQGMRKLHSQNKVLRLAPSAGYFKSCVVLKIAGKPDFFGLVRYQVTLFQVLY